MTRARSRSLRSARGCGTQRRRAPRRRRSRSRVTDGGKPVGARVLLFDAQGEPRAHRQRSTLRQAPGRGRVRDRAERRRHRGTASSSPTARGEVPVGVDACVPSPAIPYGTYKVWAWRGIEYERGKARSICRRSAARVELAIPLERAWTPHGTLAADLHVHAHASNDSHDAQPAARRRAGRGRHPGRSALSDHNVERRSRRRDRGARSSTTSIASIASNELTSAISCTSACIRCRRPQRAARRRARPTSVIHADADAAVRDRARDARPPDRPGQPSAVPRRPRCTTAHGWDGVAWPPPFPLDVRCRRGARRLHRVQRRPAIAASTTACATSTRSSITAISIAPSATATRTTSTGCSTAPRATTSSSTIRARARSTRPAFVAAIRARRVVATTGPWLDVEVAPTEGATPTVGPGPGARAARAARCGSTSRSSQAKFVHVERIRITVGGADGSCRRSTCPPACARITGRARSRSATPTRGSASPPMATRRCRSSSPARYQKDKWSAPASRRSRSHRPILVDADGDGHWKRGDADVSVRTDAR